ncbi:MAG: hypothetical protein KR126chlam6_00038 [Candidatus Anoxychlamydiales bacterium]|nr:hypothetical protein [Candidatus Anoxychlamydiales bacterium]
MSCFSFSQPVASFGNCLGAVATQASNILSSLTSKSVSERATDLVAKTSQAYQSISDYRTYSPEGSKFMRYANTLVPGALFVASGMNFAVYAHKTDSKSQKIAAYLLGAASIIYGISQIVDYLNITSCIGKEIPEKKSDYDEKFRKMPGSVLSDSFIVKYNSHTEQPEYSFLKFIARDAVTSDSENSRCF